VRHRGAIVLTAIVTAAVLAAAPARAGSIGAGAGVRAQISRPESDRLIRVVARMYGLDPGLLAAIAHVESGGNPQAISPKGAEGMMQLMPATAQRFGIADPFDPIANVLGAARFIAFLRGYHPQSGGGPAAGALTLPEMLAAYNAGEGAVDKYRGIPPYAETQLYVRRVLIAYLLGDDRGQLAQKLRASALNQRLPAAGGQSQLHGNRAPRVRRPADSQSHDNALARLGAIRIARAAELERERNPLVAPAPGQGSSAK